MTATLPGLEQTFPARVMRRGGALELHVAWTDWRTLGSPATGARITVRGDGWERTAVVQLEAGSCLLALRGARLDLPSMVVLAVEHTLGRLSLTVYPSEPDTEAA